MDLRALLLQGKAYREEYAGDINGKPFAVTIRPLTDAEKASLKVSDAVGIDMSDIAADMSRGASKDELMAALMRKYGAQVLERQMSGFMGQSANPEEDQKLCSQCIMDGDHPMFTLAEVKELFLGDITTKIAERIRQISGLSVKAAEELEPFRQ